MLSCIRGGKFISVYNLSDLSAVTGKSLGHLGLVFIWSCFVSCLLFLLFYVSLRNLCSGTCRKIQLFSSVACFVWKPADFEFYSHGDIYFVACKPGSSPAKKEGEPARRMSTFRYLRPEIKMKVLA